MYYHIIDSLFKNLLLKNEEIIIKFASVIVQVTSVDHYHRQGHKR